MYEYHRINRVWSNVEQRAVLHLKCTVAWSGAEHSVHCTCYFTNNTICRHTTATATAACINNRMAVCFGVRSTLWKGASSLSIHANVYVELNIKRRDYKHTESLWIFYKMLAYEKYHGLRSLSLFASNACLWMKWSVWDGFFLSFLDFVYRIMWAEFGIAQCWKNEASIGVWVKRIIEHEMLMFIFWWWCCCCR